VGDFIGNNQHKEDNFTGVAAEFKGAQDVNGSSESLQYYQPAVSGLECFSIWSHEFGTSNTISMGSINRSYFLRTRTVTLTHELGI
jgi:hypothetical protein